MPVLFGLSLILVVLTHALQNLWKGFSPPGSEVLTGGLGNFSGTAPEDLGKFLIEFFSLPPEEIRKESLMALTSIPIDLYPFQSLVTGPNRHYIKGTT